MDLRLEISTAVRRIRLSVPDVAIYRGRLARTDWQVIDGLPVTTAARTIRDLAAVSTDAGHLASVVRDVLVGSLASTGEVVEALAEHAFIYGHRALDGQGFLDALIEQAGVPATTRDLARRANLADLARTLTPTVSAARQQVDSDTWSEVSSMLERGPALQNLRSLLAETAAQSLFKVNKDLLASKPRLYSSLFDESARAALSGIRGFDLLANVDADSRVVRSGDVDKETGAPPQAGGSHPGDATEEP
ncbi:hypothetical protein [Nocardia sp. CC227C]|uniref:hypothetical protein n=1 Tax=Nocardia sp. CC227C TaxID=3044562 RepID=UPI00278C0E3A|nr:hypothetical protein [Nocardia sp. CC227C]